MAYSEREEEKNYFLERREVWKQEQKEKGNTVKNKRVVETEPVNYFMDHRKAKEEAARQEIRINQTQQYTPELTDIRRQDRENAYKTVLKNTQQMFPSYLTGQSSSTEMPYAAAFQDKSMAKKITQKTQEATEKWKEARKKEESLEKIGYIEGNSFINYSTIPSRSDYEETVKAAKKKAAENSKGLYKGSNLVEAYRNSLLGKQDPDVVLKATNSFESSGNSIRKYALMSELEQDIYNYIFQRSGKKQADKYLDSLEGELNKRGAQKKYELSEEKTGITRVGANIISSFEGGAQNAVTGIKQLPDVFFGIDREYNPTEFELFQDKLLSESSGAEGMSYKVANAIGNMAPTIALGSIRGAGIAGTAFAAQTAGQTYRQDIMEGRPSEGAQINAVLTAADEAVTNWLLGGIAQYGGGTVKKLLGNSKIAQAAKQGISKALSKNSKVRQGVLSMMGYGADMLSEGTQEAVQDITESIRKHFIYGDTLDLVGDITDPQTWEDFAIGALTAGVLNAPGKIYNHVQLEQYGRTIDKDYREYSQGINTDPSIYSRPEDHAEAVNLQQMAQEYADRQRRGEFIKNREKVEYDIRYRRFNEAIQNQQSQEDTARQEPQEQAESPETRENTMESTEAQREASELQETGQFSDQEEVNQAEAYRQPYGQYGGEALVNSYDGTVDIAAYNKAFGRAYDAGYHDIDLDTAQRSAIMSVLTNDQMMAAYEAGIHDYNIDNQIVPQYKKGAAREGGLGAVSELASQDQQTVAENVGKMTGLKINLVDDMMEGASASYKPGEITINVNAEDFNGTMAHELTHFIKDQAPEDYEAYKQIIVEAEMKASGHSWEEMMESYHSRYGEAGQELTRQEVIEEIAADAAQKFLNDPEFIDAVIKKDKNLAQKVIEFLSDVVDALKNLIHTGNLRAAAKNLEENAKFYEEARDLWIYSVHQGGERYKSGEVRENSSGEANGNKNQDGTGNNREKERFQLDDVDNTSDDEIRAVIEENGSLKEANENLIRQIKLTKTSGITDTQIKGVAGKILKEYKSQYNRERLENNLVKLFNYIHAVENPNAIEVAQAAANLGKGILKQSSTVDKQMQENYKDLRKKIRTTKLFISEADRADLAADGGYNDFKKRYRGKMRLGDEGISIDSFYEELAGEHPELFDLSITHPADRLRKIGDVIDATELQTLNPYYAEINEMSHIVGQQIIDEYMKFSLDPATVPEKLGAELKRLHNEYQVLMRTYQNDLKEDYMNREAAVKRALLSERTKMTEKFNNASDVVAEAMKAGNKEVEKDYRSKMNFYKDRIRELNYNLGQVNLITKPEKYIANMEKNRERKAKTQKKKQIIRDVMSMQKWLLQPTPQYYIADALKGAVLDFIHSIDYSSKYLNQNGEPTERTRAWEKLEDFFNTVKDTDGWSDHEGTAYYDIDPDIAKRINELKNKVRDIKNLEELGGYELDELQKVVSALKMTVMGVNELKANRKAETVTKLANGIFKDLSSRKTRTEYAGSISGATDRLINYDMLDPQTMFGLMGDNMKSVYDSFRTGLDKKTVHLKESEDYVRNLMKENDITIKQLRQWTGKKAKATAFQTKGGTLHLTVAGVMSLYEENKRRQAQIHMRSRKGGVKPAPRMVREGLFLKVDKAKRAITLTEEDVNSITSSLTAQQKAFADGLQQFMGTQCAAWGNEVSREMYGYEKFTARNYFPIVTDKNFINTKQGDIQNKESTIKNMGMTKNTIPNANNPIIIEDIFEVFTRQVDRMSTYNAYVVPLSDLNKVVNYRDEGNKNSIKEAIERAFGKKGNEYINKLVQDINGSIHTEKGHLDGLLSAWKGSAISGNLRVAIQQPTAYLRAMAEISPQYLTMGAMTVTRKGQWDRIAQYAPIAQWKDWGFYKMDTSRQLKDVLFGTDTLVGRINQIAMFPAEAGDKLAWNRLWRACEFEIRDKYKNLEPGSEAFYKKVGARFSEIVDRTQVVDSVLHRTQIMRSTNELTKLATSFMAEPLKSYDMLYRAASGVKYGIPGAKKAAAGAAAAYVLSSVATALAASVWDSLRDDDREKEFSEKYRENVVDNLLDAAFFINNIPIAKDIAAAIQGETIARSDMQGIQDLYYAIHEIAKSAEGESKYTPQYVAVYAIEHASKITGLPVGNIIREVRTISDTIVNESADLETDYNWIKNKYSMGNKENLNLYVSMMIQARRSRDSELEQTIKNDLNRSGMDNDTIGGRIKRLIRDELITEDSIDPRIDLAVQAMDEGNDTAYTEAVTQLVREGYSQALVSSAIDLRLKQLRGEEEIDWEAEEKVDPDKLYEEILAAPDEEQDLQIEWKSSYSSSDIVQAVKAFTLGDKNSLAAFNEAAENYYQTQRKNGTEKSKAIGNLKRIISTEYKPQWIEAYNTGDKETYEEIQNRLKQLKVDGKYLYSGEDWTSWRKTAKEKAKEE